MKKATLCFVKKGDKILLINRCKPPFMGLWNALGGKLKEGETVTECARREIFEESGILVDNIEIISTFTWNYDDEVGYATLSVLPDNFDESSFIKNFDEGVVLFRSMDWILDEKNYGVIDDLRVFIEDIKEKRKNDYHLIYDKSKLIEVIKK